MIASVWQASLGEVQSEVAAAQPAPAGVATAAISAALGLSLLIKVLRITGARADLLPPALQILEELRADADADIEAVRAYIRSRETRGLHESPRNALLSVTRAMELCAQAKGAVQGLIAADLIAAISLLEGASNAIRACIAANER